MSQPHAGQLLAQALSERADQVVVRPSSGEPITGADLASRISRFVQVLAEHQVSTGSPLGLLSGNHSDVLTLIGAGQTQGYRRTALHPLGSVADHAFVLADAGISTLIVDPAYADVAARLITEVDCLTQVFTLGPAAIGTDLVALADSAPEEPLSVADLAEDHVLSVTYTGGTTGRPKGVVGTVSSLSAMARVMLAEWEFPQRPRFLMCTPLSHAGAAFFTPVVRLGGELVVTPRFDPGEVLRLIEAEQINATMLVPSMIYALLDHPDLADRDLGSLETVFYGAAPINPVRLQQALEVIGPVFAQYYGQSECPMVVSYLSKAAHIPGRLGSCGRPSPSLRTSLRDSEGHPVETGRPGEIWVAGDVVADGYWNRPEETEAAFGHDGWLRTGDVARSDEEGYWTIVDRVKDMIVTGGENVYSTEVENALSNHPAVAQVAVIGIPHDVWGEQVHAVVVLNLGVEVTEDELREHARLTIAGYKVPKSIEFRADPIPLSGAMKPLKRELRAPYWEGRGSAVN